MDIFDALERLAGERGPSGFERPVAQAARELLSPLVDETWLDRMGNLIGVRRCGRPGAKKLLLDAHLDEIGLMVTGHAEGFLRFAAIGGVDPRMLPDREVTVLTHPPLPGVVACLPPHVLTREEEDKAIPVDKLCIDVGLTQEEAQRRVPVGAPITYRGGCFPLGKKRICGKSLDDRACFAALLLCPVFERQTRGRGRLFHGFHPGGGLRGGGVLRRLCHPPRLLRGGGRDPRPHP